VTTDMRDQSYGRQPLSMLKFSRMCLIYLFRLLVSHSNLLPFLSVDKTSFLGIASEWMERGTILQLVKQRGD